MCLFFLYLSGKQMVSFVHAVTLASVGCMAVPNFATLSHKRHDFRRKGTEYKMRLLIFSTTSIWNISHSAIYYHKCTMIFMWSTCLSSQILMKLEISRQILEKYSNITFNENHPTRIRVVPCGRADRHGEAVTLAKAINFQLNKRRKCFD